MGLSLCSGIERASSVLPGGPEQDSLAGARAVSLVDLMARAARDPIWGVGRLVRTLLGGVPCPRGSWVGWRFAGHAQDLAGAAPIGSSQAG